MAELQIEEWLRELVNVREEELGGRGR